MVSFSSSLAVRVRTAVWFSLTAIVSADENTGPPSTLVTVTVSSWSTDTVPSLALTVKVYVLSKATGSVNS